jgi:xylan 1,4-beta-xylosidase
LGATLWAIEKAGVRGEPDVDAVATVDENQMAILVWNYHDEDGPGAAAEVEISVKGVPARLARETWYRIDQTHSNSFTAWHEMGSPESPTGEQYAKLKEAGRLMGDEAKEVKIEGGRFSEKARVERRGVGLLVLTFE